MGRDARQKKVGYLRNEWQAADKLFRDGHQASYEKEAKYLYGFLREAWERAVEEVLLGGIIERYRPGVQTQQIGMIADITDEDCRTVDSAMTKCSKWLPGHDQAAAARAPVPEPTRTQGRYRGAGKLGRCDPQASSVREIEPGKRGYQTRFRMTRVVLAAAHLDSDPTNNRLRNLRALCQPCHMLQDRPYHLAQRWITYRRRSAVGDLFLGPYPSLPAGVAFVR